MLEIVLPALIGGMTSVLIIFLNNIREQRNFKRDHNYNQLTELYLELYAVIIQSEYLRYFSKKYRNMEFVFWKIPFLETKRIRRKITNGKIIEEEIKTLITEFNKKYLVEKIFDNKKYASQDLLKLAVAYRYANEYYLENNDNEQIQKAFQLEEVKLIYLMVKTITKECNMYLENCNMPYDASELSCGRINFNVFEKDNFYY